MYGTGSSLLVDTIQRLIHYSLRIEPDLHELLERESKRKRISLNNLLNHIVRQYVVNESFERIASVPMPKDVLREIFGIAQDDILAERARKIGSKNAVEYVGIFFHAINEDAALQFLDVWFSRFPGYEHRHRGNMHSFSVPHDINEKFSLYTKELVSAFVESTMKKLVKFIQITPRAITFSIEV